MSDQLNLTAPVSKGAGFSPCRTYRYHLWRKWDNGKAMVNYVMLNPSTADESANDPTVERCERRARMLGYGGLFVTNLFAYRATDPRDMKAAADPVGPDNNDLLLFTALRCKIEGGIVICAWGAHGGHRGRAAEVLALLRGAGVPLNYLRLTDQGHPSHPLYLPYELQPQPWAGA